MSDWNTILEEITQKTTVHQSEVISVYDNTRRSYLRNLYSLTDRNTVIYYSGWLQKGNIIGTEINDEDKNGFVSVLNDLDPSKGLDVILHTHGGEVGATFSIVDYLISTFGDNIRVIVPQIAMSGGTIIACACRDLYMGKYSNLGPIDPQVFIPGHGYTAAGAIIEEFSQISSKIDENVNNVFLWQPILSQYSPGLIIKCQKAVELTKEKVKVLLSEGMFANTTDPSQISNQVVDILTNYEELKSHDLHLSADFCNKKVGLKINYLEDDPTFEDIITSIHNVCMHTFTNTAAHKIIENHNGKAFIKLSQPPPDIGVRNV